MKAKLLILSLCFSALFSLQLSAQSITIRNFRLDISDQTANSRETELIDDNGKPCALIRIQTTEKGFAFEGGSIGIAKVEENHIGEIWVYVPANLRRITIRHQQLGTLKDFAFPEQLQPARTYTCDLISARTTVLIDQDIRYQYLVLTVNPSSALVEIDDEIVEAENGVASKYLPFGKHSYRVSNKNFHTEAGNVVIDDPDNKKEIAITLKPAYGWIEFLSNETLRGASVFIDNEKVGDLPLKPIQIKSGNHDIRVVKEKYSPWRNQVIVNDEQTVQVSPNVSANFAHVTLQVEGDAEIWWNNSMIGRGSCTMDFDYGEQKFETRKAHHRTQSTVVNITPASEGTMQLPAPLPIYGSLNIEVRPAGSNIYLDDEKIGTTPMLIQKVLIGTHSLRVSHSGMRTDSRTIEIEEGKTFSVSATLSKELNVLRTRPTITDGNCVISDEYDVIADNLFYNCKTLRTISMPTTISAIGASAFSGCYQLRSITLPQSIKAIEPNTFYWCAALKTIAIPEGVTSIGANAFTNCYSLESITLPSTLTSIAPDAFTDCKSLKYIYVPATAAETLRNLLPSALRSKIKETH